ncbi:type III toxin-antitoxin system ToxN/AbiQ family toxin, partial [Ursidibacter maritimus]
DYVDYLKSLDYRVSNNYDNKTNKKPYTGVVFSKGYYSYYIPLTSDKEEKYKNLPRDRATVHDLYEITTIPYPLFLS